jgi:hypothetical protein
MLFEVKEKALAVATARAFRNRKRLLTPDSRKVIVSQSQKKGKATQ